MEYNEQCFLDELLALRRDYPWEATNIPPGMSTEFYNNGWSLDCFDENPFPIPPSSSFDGFSLPLDQTLNCSFSEFYCPLGDHDQFSALEVNDHPTSNTKFDTPRFPSSQEDYSMPPILDDEEPTLIIGNGPKNLEPIDQSSAEAPIAAFNMGLCLQQQEDRMSKAKKKVGAQPSSKNLMAERRRRKRLNDRLSMLRSVVPKISKMDRTSILGDTIDYMKELLQRINKLHQEIEMVGSNDLNFVSIFGNEKPKEVLIRNSPKFDVERRNMETRIEICCAGKPDLLLSTVTTLEALGLEIQQCVISCFNDFTMQASCSEELEQKGIIRSEDIKESLFRNAGYGGRCL